MASAGTILACTAVVGVTALAAALRFWGIRWGLPDALHKFTFHPDEVFQVGAILQLNPFRLDLDPGFYNYPSFYMNLGAAVLRIGEAYGFRVDDSLTGAYLVARLVTAAFGILTVPLVYLAARKLYGTGAGLLAACILAITPLHVVHSHFATVDVPAALWVAAALLGASTLLSRPALKVYLLAGAAAGFAAGTKYNAALVLLPIITSHFLRESGDGWRSRLRDGRLWASVGAFVVSFFAATPGVLIWPGRFVGKFLYELQHAASGHGLLFVGRGPGWFDVLANSLGYGQGVFLLVLSAGAVALAVARHKRSDFVLLSFLVPYYLLISFSSVRFARYAIPMLIPLSILAGRMIAELYAVVKDHRATATRLVWVAVSAGIIGYTGVYALAFDRLFSQPDPRTEAALWFRANVPRGARIGLPTIPWFYSPPLAPGIIGTVGPKNRYDLMSESPYRLMSNPRLPWDSDLITRGRPDYVVISDYEYEDLRRLHDRGVETFLRKLGRSYVEAAVFRNGLSALGIDFGPTEKLPHDLKYMAPTIRVFRRR